jgi:cytochrome c-type biogenesis protein CcmH
VSAGRKLSWLAAVLVLGGALLIAAVGDPGPRTQSEQVYAIAATLKCPQCAGQTVAESDTAISREIRAEISDGLAAGMSPDEIRADIASGYEVEIRLDPSSSGVTGVVWALPVVVAVGAIAGLLVVFRRWSGQRTAPPTDDDRALVEAALAERHAGDAGTEVAR